MTAPMPNNPKKLPSKKALLLGLTIFALALCGLVVVMMLRRGPALAY